MDVDDCLPGLVTYGETSPEICRLPMGPKLGLVPRLREDSRRGEPMCEKDVPWESSSFFCWRCLANKAPNRDGLDASGEPTLEKLVLVIPSPLKSRWLELRS